MSNTETLKANTGKDNMLNYKSSFGIAVVLIIGLGATLYTNLYNDTSSSAKQLTELSTTIKLMAVKQEGVKSSIDDLIQAEVVRSSQYTEQQVEDTKAKAVRAATASMIAALSLSIENLAKVDFRQDEELALVRHDINLLKVGLASAVTMDQMLNLLKQVQQQLEIVMNTMGLPQVNLDFNNL